MINAARAVQGQGGPRVKKLIALAVAAALSTGAVTAIAVQDSATRAPATAECTAFKSAAQTAMQNQLTIVNQFMSGASSQMQAAVSKNNSCIGNLALLDFDLSKLIPDFGLLGMLLQKAIDSLVNGVINRACAAVSSVLDKPGEIWNSITGQININGQFQDWSNGIDYTIAGIGTGSGSGTGNRPTPTTPIGGVGTLPVTCTETVAGRVCTDGSTSGTGVNPKPVSGAEIGAQYQQLRDACSGALAQDESNGPGYRPDTKAACRALQDFMIRYREYLDPTTFPRIPDFTQSPVVGDSGGTGTGGGAGAGTGGAVFGGTGSGGGTGDAVFGGTTKTSPAPASKPGSAFSLPVRE